MSRWPEGYKGADADRHAANMRRIKAGKSTGCAVLPLMFLTASLSVLVTTLYR